MIDAIFWFVLWFGLGWFIYGFAKSMRRHYKRMKMERMIRSTMAANSFWDRYEIVNIVWNDDYSLHVDVRPKDWP